VNLDLVTGRLLDAGFDAEDAATRAALVDRAVRTFRRQMDTEPHAGWFVPGRIEVFGKHTDYAGGRSLVAAVPRGFALVAAPRDDDIITVIDARWRDAVDIDPAEDTRRFRGWSNYAAVVGRRFARNFPGAPLGVTIVLASDLPRAAGLSSSSALVVGLALALIHRARLRERPEWRDALATGLDLAGYLGAVENGLNFKNLPGASGVGTHGGSEDHTAILNARAGMVSAFSYVPVRHVADADLPDAWRFVVMASGVRADKAGSVKDLYNRASLGTRALAGLWSARTGAPPTTLGALLRADGAQERLEALLDGPWEGFSADELRRRLTHFVAEDGRIEPAVAAFREANWRALGELSAASQRDADLLLGNQIPETRQLVTLARGGGAFAASSFGAGFGGSVWALARTGEAVEMAERWRRSYSRAFPAAGEIEWFVTRPSPAAVELFAAE